MMLTYFEGQEAFLKDYQKAAKQPVTDQQQVVKEVLKQLNTFAADEKIFYVLSGDETVTGAPVRFPFLKKLVAHDAEATVSTEFFYTGEPYVYQVLEDEEL